MSRRYTLDQFIDLFKTNALFLFGTKVSAVSFSYCSIEHEDIAQQRQFSRDKFNFQFRNITQFFTAGRTAPCPKTFFPKNICITIKLSQRAVNLKDVAIDNSASQEASLVSKSDTEICTPESSHSGVGDDPDLPTLTRTDSICDHNTFPPPYLPPSALSLSNQPVGFQSQLEIKLVFLTVALGLRQRKAADINTTKRKRIFPGWLNHLGDVYSGKYSSHEVDKGHYIHVHVKCGGTLNKVTCFALKQRYKHFADASAAATGCCRRDEVQHIFHTATPLDRFTDESMYR
ncbi:hypothetical protein F2P81_007938 [Scophthalmus maximus]|uniref:Uncharacterized protein n=1 Tax=Scophthalmus maximus TaxID=52904 RepID=A0A6A4T0V3_SCOMX|nr:hypothetical protein F2P81_007938 [Scophthalmus maximus]